MIAALTSSVAAQTTYNWVAPGSGAFGGALNWSPAGGPPGTLDVARFFAPGSSPVISFANPCVNRRLMIEDADVKLLLNGHPYTLSNGSPSLSVMTTKLGGLRISGGTLTSDSTVIDSIGVGAAGAVHVLSNAAWSNSAQVIVGDAGHGIVTLAPFSQASSPSTILGHLAGSDADFILHGPLATWDNSAGAFVAGASGAGLLFLDSGACLLGGSGTISANAGSGFTAILDGSGTRWNMPAGQTIIAGAGDATLQLHSGASMSSGPLASIADQPGSEGTMLVKANSFAGCTWSIAGNLHVGRGGNGSLTVNNPGGPGASVSVGGAATVGTTFGGLGTIVINGAGAFIAANAAITAGDGGNASITVRNAASLQTGGAVVGRLKGAAGQVLLDGAATRWTNTAPVTIAAAGAGTVTLSNGPLLSAPTVAVGALGRLAGVGRVESAVTNGGVVAPGNSAGKLSIIGSYAQQPAGTLEIELGGLLAGTQHDWLAVDGAAVLGGSLLVTLINQFQPTPGQQFVVLTAGSVSGQFSNVVAPTGMSVVYGPSEVRLIFVAAECVPADLNCDETVNGLDLALLLGQWMGKSAYAPCPPAATADLNADCKINGLDLALLLGAWG